MKCTAMQAVVIAIGVGLGAAAYAQARHDETIRSVVTNAGEEMQAIALAPAIGRARG